MQLNPRGINVAGNPLYHGFLYMRPTTSELIISPKNTSTNIPEAIG